MNEKAKTKTMTMRNIAQQGLVLLALLGAGCENGATLELSDAGVADGDEIVRASNLSACAEKRKNELSMSPYASLHRWYSATRGDTFVSADPAWIGCTGDTRSSADSTSVSYAWVEELGLVFRPDWQQPSGTVPLYSYEAWLARSGTPYFDQRVTTQPVMNYGQPKLQGYVYPPDRSFIPTGPVALYQYESSSPTGDFYVKLSTSPARPGGETQGAIIAQLPVHSGPFSSDSCAQHSQCAASEVCVITDGDVELSDGTSGSCVKRCRTDADCPSDATPRCDLVAQHCVDPMASYSGALATFTRSTDASYLFAANALAWAPANTLRREDRGDGLGALPLLEGAATNLLKQSNEVGDVWQGANLLLRASSDAPGAHPSIVVESTGATTAYLEPINFTGITAAATFSNSFWYRSELPDDATSGLTYADVLRIGASQTTTSNRPASASWVYAAHTVKLSSGTGLPTVLRIGAPTGATTAGQRRYVAYAQLEASNFSTSTIVTDGMANTRAADVLEVAVRDQRMRQPFRLVFSPYAASNEMSTTVPQTLISFRNGSGVETHAIQFLGTVLRLVNAAGTVLGSVTVSAWSRHQLLYVDVNPSTRVFTFSGTGALNTFTATAADWAAPGGIRVGSRSDGSQPFFGRMSEPWPLDKATSPDVIPPRALYAYAQRNQTDAFADLKLMANEHVASGSTFVLREGSRMVTGNLSLGTASSSTMQGALDPGRLHTVTLNLRDAAGNASSHVFEHMAPGSRYPGPSGELVRLRGESLDQNNSRWLDMSANDHHPVMDPVAGLVSMGSLAGRRVALFRGSVESDQFLFSTLTSNTIGAYTLFLVGSVANNLVHPLLVTSDAKLFVDTDKRVKFTQGGQTLASTATVTNNAPFVVELRVASNGARSLWMGAASAVATDTVANSSTHIGGVMGKDGSTFMTGTVGEFIVYPSALSDSDRLTIGNYLRGLYGAP